MRHAVFVYGTLLRGEVNHGLLAGADWLGIHRTAPCFRLYLAGDCPGAVRGGDTAIRGEVYAVDSGGLRRLDRLEEYPLVYGRQLIPTPYGRAWIYVFRGPVKGRPVIAGGDWRVFNADGRYPRAIGSRSAGTPRGAQRRSRAGESGPHRPGRSRAELQIA